MASEILPPPWRDVLKAEVKAPYFTELMRFVESERATHEVYPPPGEVFTAFRLTPFDKVRVVLLGQDPYHGKGQAHGLCFSVREGVRTPPSLQNIFRELHADVGCPIPSHGCLEHWASQGVLMINAVLTVRAGEPNSHKGQGWEQFTDAVMRAVASAGGTVFLLWGAYAQKKAALIDPEGNVILKAAHPSPLSAAKFFGSRPFSAANDALAAMEKPPIDWAIPNR